MVVLRMLVIVVQPSCKPTANKDYKDRGKKSDGVLLAPEWVGKEEHQRRDSNDGLQQKLDEIHSHLQRGWF
jgi:hypothetical protein